jgi:hypothetical protein
MKSVLHFAERALIRSCTTSRAPISVEIKQPNGDVHGKACFMSKH